MQHCGAHSLITPWSRRDPELGEYPIMAEGVRAAKSYAAALNLCERGYGNPGGDAQPIHLRRLAHWVSVNLETAEQQFGDHTARSEWPEPALSAGARPKAPTGIEPVQDLLRPLEPKVRFYADHFREASGGDTSI